MTRATLCFLATILALTAPGCGSDVQKPPNVVLVVLDTLRADYLGVYGYRRQTAPFLAHLAEEGALFRKAYSSSSWTAPSTASLFTGMYPDRHGVTRGFLAQVRSPEEAVAEETIELSVIDDEARTLPELFRAAGYTTMGLATNINIGPEIGFDRGFDRLERHDDWSAGKIFQRLSQWKEELEAAQPFFLYLHLNDVHKPYDVRRRWYEEVQDLWIPPRLEEADAEQVVTTVSSYQSEIGYLDHWLGRMLSDLVPADDVLLCVASDHGEEFMDHGAIGHHLSLYTEVNRVLLLLRGPGQGVRAGVHDEEISLIDVAPTLLELAGLEVPLDVDGISLASLLRGGEPPASLAPGGRPLFAHRWANDLEVWSVIRGGWKLIDAPLGQELFHLPTDPTERENVIEEHPDVVARLAPLIDGYRARGYGAETRAEVEIGEDLLERLRELGYVGEGGEGGEGEGVEGADDGAAGAGQAGPGAQGAEDEEGDEGDVSDR